MIKRPLTALALALVLAACATTHPAQQAAPATSSAPAPAVTGTAGERAVAAYFAPAVAGCERGDAASCARLARRLGWVTNDVEAVRVAGALSKGCAAHVPSACAGEAIAIAHGQGVPADAARGAALLAKSCDEGQALACAELAELDVRGGKQAEGQQLARQSCERLGGWPCLSAVMGLDEKANAPRILALLQRACDGGDPYACYQLGMFNAEGGGVVASPDPKAATAFYTKACDADLAPACFNLGWQYQRGTGAETDAKRARQLFERACTLGDATACDELAREDGEPRRYCELWGAQACYDVAMQLGAKHGETAEVAEDMIWAGDHGCRRGHTGSCNAMMHLRKDTIRACTMGQDPRNACTFAGLMYALVAHDRHETDAARADATAKARQALARACESGAAPACEAGKRLAP